MITKFKIFENKPPENDKTIAVRSTDNPDFYINIYFNDNDEVIYVEKSFEDDRIGLIPNCLEGKKVTFEEIERFYKNINSLHFSKRVLYCDYLYNVIAKNYNL